MRAHPEIPPVAGHGHRAHLSVGKTLKYLWYSDGFAALIWVTLTTSCSVQDFRMCPVVGPVITSLQ